MGSNQKLIGIYLIKDKEGSSRKIINETLVARKSINLLSKIYGLSTYLIELKNGKNSIQNRFHSEYELFFLLSRKTLKNIKHSSSTTEVAA